MQEKNAEEDTLSGRQEFQLRCKVLANRTSGIHRHTSHMYTRQIKNEKK
jgi:hypothetical protein